ncbi:MAG: winged helix-turn-helix transcriptional regulator [Bacteroidetes bacterium]|nr:winged helix-turn-helix transcriptional regulator [Bacteroidota bacterium]
MKSAEKIVPDFFSALGHISRIRIIEAMRDGERCQCELPDLLGIEQSNLSRHIKILAASGALRSRRDGTRMMLSVDPCIHDLVGTARELLRTRVRTQTAVLEQP